MSAAFVPAVEPSAERRVPAEPALWFAFAGDRLLIHERGEAAELPLLDSLDDLGLSQVRRLYLGTLAGRDLYAAELAEGAVLPEGMATVGLRQVYGRLQDELFALAGRAVQLLTWDRNHLFCGHCGTRTEQLPGERAKRCPACGLTAYPRVSPAIIVLVTRGEQLLLTRGHHFAPGFYGVLAGFVEPGESLEEAVEREIAEEVGLRVREIRYFGSQPWPFPHQLMIGFNALWAEGEIRVDPHELADAGWFTAASLPHIPPRFSIARRLIDAFLGDERAAPPAS